jgi:DNA (cytosine-5)-methyltransferase 1
LELFTGGAGLALGLERAGFRHLAVVERDKHSCATLRKNRGPDSSHPWPIFETDVRAFDYSKYEGRTDLLGAGVPCQPFSLAGKHRGHADERNLFPALLDAVRGVWPRAILVENVRGLVRPGFLPFFEYVMDQLRLPTLKLRRGENWKQHRARLATARISSRKSDTTYRVGYRLIECADYGVPQQRKRVIVVALRSDLAVDWTWPETTHSEEALLYAKWVDESYWKRHRMEPKRVPTAVRSRVDELRGLPQPAGEPWRTVRDALSGLPDPVNGVPHPFVLNHVGIPGARVYPGHSGSDRDWPAKTLKAGVHGVPGGEATVILDNGRVRYFTVRESARLQTFPDDYEFVGVRSETMRQIGNALPVVVAHVVGARIASVLSEA